jgi:hypothetical protein
VVGDTRVRLEVAVGVEVEVEARSVQYLEVEEVEKAWDAER